MHRACSLQVHRFLNSFDFHTPSLFTIYIFVDRKLFVHGFALDSSGRKMSKSIGNIIDPQDVIDGDGKKLQAFGIDVLR